MILVKTARTDGAALGGQNQTMMLNNKALGNEGGQTMPLVARPARVCGIMESPVFAERILDRILSHSGLSGDLAFPMLDIRTRGRIPREWLEQIRVVLISGDGPLMASVNVANSQDGSAELFLDRWQAFENHDPRLAELKQGMHFWLCAAWKHVPHVRAVI